MQGLWDNFWGTSDLFKRTRFNALAGATHLMPLGEVLLGKFFWGSSFGEVLLGEFFWGECATPLCSVIYGLAALVSLMGGGVSWGHKGCGQAFILL
jgi:hypothetical protein